MWGFLEHSKKWTLNFVLESLILLFDHLLTRPHIWIITFGRFFSLYSTVNCSTSSKTTWVPAETMSLQGFSLCPTPCRFAKFYVGLVKIALRDLMSAIASVCIVGTMQETMWQNRVNYFVWPFCYCHLVTFPRDQSFSGYYMWWRGTERVYDVIDCIITSDYFLLKNTKLTKADLLTDATNYY